MRKPTRRGFLRHAGEAGVAIATSKLLTGCTAAPPVIPDTPTTEGTRVAFGTGGHNHNQPAAIFPDTMRWLWRDYAK